MKLVPELSVLNVDQHAQDWNYIFGGTVYKLGLSIIPWYLDGDVGIWV